MINNKIDEKEITSKIEKLKANLENLEKKKSKLEREIMTGNQELFKLELHDIFKQNPKLESFSWRQFTPYWNDGEECTFEVYGEYPRINGLDDDFDEEDTDLKREEFDNLSEIVSSFIYDYDQEYLKEVFGDHVRVTIYSDGEIEVSEYTSHD